MKILSKADADRLREIGRFVQQKGALEKPPINYFKIQGDLERIADQIEELLSDAGSL